MYDKYYPSFADPKGGGGDRGSDPHPLNPMKNHKAIGFLINTGPDPLFKHEDTKPAFNVGPSSARFSDNIIWIHSPMKKSYIGPTLIKLSGSTYNQ